MQRTFLWFQHHLRSEYTQAILELSRVSIRKGIPTAKMAAIFRARRMFWITALSLYGILRSVTGLLRQPPTSLFSTARQKSKPILAQTSCKNFAEDSSHDTNNEKQTRLDESLWTQDESKDISLRHNIELRDPVFSRDNVQTKNLLHRRSIASVAIRKSLAIFFGGSTTSAILTGKLPVHATSVTSLSPIDEKRDEARFISSDISLPVDNGDTVELPLEFIATLDAYVVRYFLFGEPFAAIVDTGSPFLTVPCYCKPYRNRKMFWGCYKPELTRDSGYGNTIEGFDNNYGTVVWRKAGFSFFPSATQIEVGSIDLSYTDTTTDVVFGVLDRDLLNGPGGVFFGLIKETDRWIRPSFLGQTGYASFCVDLRHKNHAQEINDTENFGVIPRLVLSKQSMIGTGKWLGINSTLDNGGNIENEDWIPLVRDLKKKYGAPVVHYTVKANSLIVNGLPLLINKKKPLYVIIDTGVSGMVVSQELFDGRYLQARKNREKSLWGTVEVCFLTNSGKTIALNATKPITTPLGKATPWKGFNGNLIVMGLAFLEGFATTVDVDDGKILFVKG